MYMYVRLVLPLDGRPLKTFMMYSSPRYIERSSSHLLPTGAAHIYTKFIYATGGIIAHARVIIFFIFSLTAAFYLFLQGARSDIYPCSQYDFMIIRIHNREIISSNIYHIYK